MVYIKLAGARKLLTLCLGWQLNWLELRLGNLKIANQLLQVNIAGGVRLKLFLESNSIKIICVTFALFRAIKLMIIYIYWYFSHYKLLGICESKVAYRLDSFSMYDVQREINCISYYCILSWKDQLYVLYWTNVWNYNICSSFCAFVV